MFVKRKRRRTPCRKNQPRARNSVRSTSVTDADCNECCICVVTRTRYDTAANHERFNIKESVDGAKSRALALSMRSMHRHDHSINSAEGRTPHESSSVICMRLASRITCSDRSLCDSDSLCSTVATSSELVATVDHDGHRINSAGARTPHEPSLSALMQFAYSSHAVVITLTSAHRQRVGRRPGRPY